MGVHWSEFCYLVGLEFDHRAPEAESVLCEDAGDPVNCKVAMGFGLGWRIVEINVEINNETILDHTGADSDVKTFASFIPKRKTGAIIFTDGPNVGHQMIQGFGNSLPEPDL